MSYVPNAALGTPGSAVPAIAEQIAGSDGTDLRTILTDATGQVKVLVENSPTVAISGTVPVSGTVTADIVGHAGATLDGTAGSPSTGVLTVQGVSGGTAQPVTIAKLTRIVTTTPPAANGTFTSAWFDSNSDGTLYLICSYYLTASVPIGSNFMTIQESEDTTNANMTRTIMLSANGSSVGLTRIGSLIKARYYRISFTNGANAQATGFEVTLSCMNFIPSATDGTLSQATTTLNQIENIIYTSGQSAGASEPQTTNAANYIADETNTARPLCVIPLVAPTGASMYMNRTPSTYASVSTAAAGNTAVVSPAAGTKFRLLKYIIEVTADATLAAAGELVISFQDSATAIGISHTVYVPAAAGDTLATRYTTGWIDLGQFGYVSTTAANALNVNLSVALATGKVNVIFAGIVAASA